jgi:alpha-tubulin suppressor-like RCC1 family protein
MKKFVLAGLTVGTLMACGTTPSNGITGIGISATQVVLKESENTVLNATVTGTGTFNNAVTWAFENTAHGTLSSSSGNSITYTAPSNTFGKVVRITATSVENPSQKKTIYLGVHPQKPSIAAGEHHSLALKTDGSILAWGADASGQLGDGGTNADKLTPVLVNGVSGMVAVATGKKHSLGLKLSNGTVLAWGNDASGQLGDGGTNSNQSNPVTVTTGVVAIAAGFEHSLALKTDGTVLAWGADGSGQLGDGVTLTNQSSPVAVSGATDIVAIAADGGHSLALKADGTVLAWGNNGDGQLGDGGAKAFQPTPVAVSGATGVVAISAGGSHSLALKSDGTVLAWGNDGDGQLGDDTAKTNKPTPVAVANASGIVAINAGSYHSFAVKADGTLLAWGDDISGQLGDGGTKTDQPTPVVVSVAANIVAVSGGLSHSLALTSAGVMQAWGDDFYGQLGDDNTKAPQSAPVAVALGVGTSIRLP